MRSPLLALLLLPAAWAAPEPKVAAKDLAPAREVLPFPAASPFSCVLLELDAKGGVYFTRSRVTLDEVEANVVRATEQRAIFLRGKGQPGMEKLPNNREVSFVEVHLRVHKEAPWRHVQLLMTLLAELRTPRISFVQTDGAGQEGLVPAPLPLDVVSEGGLVIDEEEETNTAPPETPGVLTVTLLAEGERDGTFAGKAVRVPAATAFAVGKRRTTDRAKFATMLADEARAKQPKVLEVRAEARIAAGEVLAALDAARAAGVARVDLYRPVVLGQAVRSAPALPYPDPPAVR
jgi:biopolymer transport protein ExbD